MRGSVELAALCAAVALFGGCSENRARAIPPALFRPADLPDVLVPPGYLPQPGYDHLAGTWAGGLVRRYSATYSAATSDGPLSGEADLRVWMTDRLRMAGWTLVGPPGRRSQWTKTRGDDGQEQLVVETGRAGDRTIIRYSLSGRRPAMATDGVPR